ncbi:hypothetical protein [Streptomyces sp. NPDC091217]|uniref:hypothetical protein n=1 Tax=Streptomyces sp. NPDC091217 TaxID=3365975 RepID=UPI003819859B
MRLELPPQTVIDRRVPYRPAFQTLVVTPDGTFVKGLRQGSYGPDPGDPAHILCLDSRGWNCPPAGPCTWGGLV